MSRLFKESLVSIKKTKKRFISILLIVLLGVGFFAGIKATSPDMKDTLNRYYEKNKFMDFTIKSTWGISNDEITKIKDNGYKLEAGYSMDAIVKDDTDKVAHILSYNEQNSINQLTLVDGRFPKEKNECVVEYNQYHDSIKIGDTVHVVSDTLDEVELEVVGLVKSPIYISVEKGSTTLLAGTIDYFMYVPEENFKLEYYTDLYIKLDNTYDVFSKQYDKLIETETKKLEAITATLAEDRYNSVVNSATEEINQAKESYNTYSNEVAGLLTNPYVSSLDKQAINDSLSTYAHEIEEKENELKNLEKPTWYILNRDSNIGFFQYSQDADRIANIAKLFPLVFFVVAVLICLTTMTRMVEEERVQLGTLKSLGYTNLQIVSKYINYAFLATMIGSIIGVCIGFVILPKVIFNMYSMMYNIGEIHLSFNVYYAVLGTMIAILCTLLATLFTCYKELKEVPAQLMRPKSPKVGKKVFLEHLPFLWKKLTFSKKVTIRNVFRYKKRFLMTIIGIAGCTGLILAGFGLKDCITNMVPNQYQDIFRYQVHINLENDLQEEQLNHIIEEINLLEEISGYVRIHEEAVKVINHDTKETIQMIVPMDSLDNYIMLRNRKSGKKLEVNEGIIMTEKIAKLLDLKVGDKVELKGNTLYQTKVEGITENYLYHYIYMNKDLYNSNDFNSILIKTDTMNAFEEKEFSKKLQAIDGISSVEFLSSTRNIFDDTMENFGFVSLVLIVSAGLLAFVVLYNLATVNISERKRELATIKVLGFYDKEVYNYINRETTILTFIGILLGLGFGVILTNFIIKTCELDMMMFSPVIEYKSYIYSIIITLLFTFLVNIMVYFSLKKIDMIDSLKSVE